MTIIICPGMQDVALTESFVSKLLEPVLNGARISVPEAYRNYNSVNILIFPGNGLLPLSGFHILDFLHQNINDRLKSPVVFISFSAGVVGAIAAAHSWQLSGGHVRAFVAIDGWGVPLFGDFPIYRMSHDYFTHWSSSLLGGGENSFYADPPVDHLEMWENPQNVQGVWVTSNGLPPQKHLSAIYFLHMLLAGEGE
jgi:hypothetical protein